MIGKRHRVTPAPTITPSMPAQVVEALVTALRSALRHNCTTTPYKVDTWRDFLSQAALTPRYPNLVKRLSCSFRTFMPPLMQTFILPNHPLVKQYKAVFNDIIHKELSKHHYIGPLTESEIQRALGHFQTSPISLIPKPGRPGKYRMIQDLSHP